MAKKSRQYAPAFRQQMVELARSGRSPESLSREFEPLAEAIRNWVKQADRDEGRRADDLTTVEREILAKATAWFARETGSVPSKDSSS